MAPLPFSGPRSRIGVDIGATAVRAAELRLNPPALLRVAQVRLPRGAVVNGEVRDAQAVAGALTELWHMGKFKGRQVHLGIGNQRVVVREVTLPWLADKEFRAALPFQVQEQVPIPLDEAVFDYQVIEELEQEGRRMVRILLVVAQLGTVNTFVEAVQQAKLEPLGLDIVPFAIVRSVGTVDGLGLAPDSGGDEAIIDIGSDMSSICVHARGLPRFVRILPSGGNDVTQAIARSVGCTDDEAELLKRGDESEHPGAQESVADVVRSRTVAFVEEIHSSLDFYTLQARGVGIERVIITGGGSKLTGLIDLLGEQLPFEVEAGKAFRRVTPPQDLMPDALAAAEPLLAVAVGLAIPGTER